MAQLHGRIRGLPHHGRLRTDAGHRRSVAIPRAVGVACRAALASALLALAPIAIHAQDAPRVDAEDGAQIGSAVPAANAAALSTAVSAASTAVSAAELSVLATALASDDAAVRETAVRGFRALDEDALQAIEARLAAVRLQRPAATELSAALAAIRHAAGSRRADDRIDIGSGVLPALSLRRDPAMLAACESVLLWRALEAMGTTRAYRVIADVVALDGTPWEQEIHRFVERAGVRLGPMLVTVRSHPDADVRRWSRWAGTELGFDAPGRAIQLPLVAAESALLADTLRAYASVRQMDAMRVIASYVSSQHALVREVARAALSEYGRNAIWVLREQLELVTGEDADPSWGWERTMRALFDAHDEARLAPVRAELAAGRDAAARGTLDVMARHYAAVLVRAPELAQREQMAPGYALLGAQQRAAHDLAGAERAYRRALFLAPAHADAATWRAALLALHADMELTRGVADTHAYERVLVASPNDSFARAVLEQLSGERAAHTRSRKRRAMGGAALLSLIAALALVVRRPSSRAQRAPRAAESAADEHDGDTSPGSLSAPV